MSSGCSQTGCGWLFHLLPPDSTTQGDPVGINQHHGGLVDQGEVLEVRGVLIHGYVWALEHMDNHTTKSIYHGCMSCIPGGSVLNDILVRWFYVEWMNSLIPPTTRRKLTYTPRETLFVYRWNESDHSFHSKICNATSVKVVPYLKIS